MSNPGRDYDELIREFYDAWFRFHPDRALEAGVSGYEGLIGAVDDDDVGALESLLESLIVGLEEIDYQGLDESRRIDMEILFGACQEEHHQLLEQDWRHRDPLRFLPFRVLHQLVLTPQIELRNGLGVCLSRIPEYMRHARSQLSSFPELIPHPWVEAALLEGRHGLEYLTTLRDSALVRRICKNPAEIQSLCDAALAALVDFIHFLQEEVAHRAQGAIGCGEERFRRILHQRHSLSTDPARLTELVDGLFEACEQELEALAFDHNGERDPLAWLDELHLRSPLAQGDLLDFARDHSRSVSSFLDENGALMLPPRSRLKILEAPGDLQPGSCSPDYVAPMPGDPDLVGIIYLNLEGCSVSARLPAGLTGQCIRNGWTGRHLQNVIAAASPSAGSLVRRLNASATMEIGWPLYAEQLMFDLGFSRRPEESFVRLIERARRLQLARIDIGIHAGSMDAESALRLLDDLPAVSPRQGAIALMEVSRAPGSAVAGVLGWRMIAEARACVEEQDPEFELSGFHERLLEPGPIAAPLLIPHAFGREVWDAVSGRLQI